MEVGLHSSVNAIPRGQMVTGASFIDIFVPHNFPFLVSFSQILAVGDDFGRLWLYDVKGTDLTDGAGENSVTKKKKMSLALEEMRENMEELEARFKAKDDFKKW